MYLTNLTLYRLVVGTSVYVVHLLLEGIKLFTDTLGSLLFSLLLAYLTDGILNLAVALTQQFLGLLLGTAQNLLTLLFNLGNIGFQPLTSNLFSC